MTKNKEITQDPQLLCQLTCLLRQCCSPSSARNRAGSFGGPGAEVIRRLQQRLHFSTGNELLYWDTFLK